MDASEAALADAVRAQSGGAIEVVVSTVSPDGEWVAALLHVLETDNWLEAVYRRADTEWVEWTTSEGSEAWSPIETKGGVAIGVFRLYGPAPPGAERAIVSWRGERRVAPVRNGYFAFAAWDASDEEVIRTPPEASGFE
jgi:hypothetical protein